MSGDHQPHFRNRLRECDGPAQGHTVGRKKPGILPGGGGSALGQQEWVSDQAKVQSAGVLGAVQRSLGAVQGRVEPSTHTVQGRLWLRLRGVCWAELT